MDILTKANLRPYCVQYVLYYYCITVRIVLSYTCRIKFEKNIQFKTVKKTATEGVSLAAAEVDQPLNLNESHGPVGWQDSTEWVQLHGSGVALHGQLKLTLLKESIALQGRGGGVHSCIALCMCRHTCVF